MYTESQDKGKGIQLQITLEELPLVFETLKPEGVWFSNIYGIDDIVTAERVVKRIEHGNKTKASSLGNRPVL